MAKIEFYRLRDLAHRLPMSDRGGRLFDQTEQGEAIDTEDPFWRVLIADKDIIPASRAVSQPSSQSSDETAAAPAGRATRRDGQSSSRPAAEQKS